MHFDSTVLLSDLASWENLRELKAIEENLKRFDIMKTEAKIYMPIIASLHVPKEQFFLPVLFKRFFLLTYTDRGVFNWLKALISM